MRTVALPEVPYGATAVRPDWEDLPTAVREAIAGRLGTRVASATTAGGGFTRAFAAVLETVAGPSVFVKAAPITDPTADWYAREAAITEALPAGVPAPRPRWTLTVAGWFVLCLDAVDAHVPTLPWSPEDLNATLAAWSTAATALSTPPPIPLHLPDPSHQPGPPVPVGRPDQLRLLELPRLPDLIRDELSWWSEIAAGREPMPSTAPAWVPDHLGDLAALERALPPLAAGAGMLHGDLRVDNVLIDTTGRAWLCDWSWPCLGAPWFDTVTLLVSAYASGLDADALLEPWHAPAAGVSGALAAMSGYWLVRAADPPSSASPHSRQHQLFSGTQALAWLADREGW